MTEKYTAQQEINCLKTDCVTLKAKLNSAYEDAIAACKSELLVDNTGDPTDESYNQAINDCMDAIGRLVRFTPKIMISAKYLDALEAVAVAAKPSRKADHIKWKINLTKKLAILARAKRDS